MKRWPRPLGRSNQIFWKNWRSLKSETPNLSKCYRNGSFTLESAVISMMWEMYGKVLVHVKFGSSSVSKELSSWNEFDLTNFVHFFGRRPSVAKREDSYIPRVLSLDFGTETSFSVDHRTFTFVLTHKHESKIGKNQSLLFKREHILDDWCDNLNEREVLLSYFWYYEGERRTKWKWRIWRHLQ